MEWNYAVGYKFIRKLFKHLYFMIIYDDE